MSGRTVVEVIATGLGILDVRRRGDLAGCGYETLGGVRAIAEFDAYGMAPPDGDRPAGVNWGPRYRPYVCELLRLSDGSRMLRDVPNGPYLGAPFVLGGFPVLEPAAVVPGVVACVEYSGPPLVADEACDVCAGAAGGPDGAMCAECAAEAEEYARVLLADQPYPRWYPADGPAEVVS